MNARPHVVVTRRPPGDALELLRTEADIWVWEGDGPAPPDILGERVADAGGLLCMLTDRIDADLLDRAPGLQVISQMAVGTDNIDIGECTLRGIPVGHTPDVLTETTADLAFGLVLAAARRVREGIDHVLQGRWGDWDPELLLGSDVHGATLGVIGLGRIGTAVARRAAGFDMRVLYASRTRKPAEEARLGVAHRSVRSLLEEADHVVLTLPSDAETRRMIDATRLALMKPTATLVNVSRGDLIDHDALYQALSRGELAAAALDVTDPEPMPADHPLLALPNCTVIPHLGSASRATRTAMAELAVENLLAGLRGERLPACVNPGVHSMHRG